MTALKMGDLFDLTEFSFVDPDAVHLVRTAANGFDSPLLAKAAEEVGEQLIKGLTDQFLENFCSDDGCEVCKGRFLVLREADSSFVEKAKLKAKDRKALPDTAFALPETREYPIHDESHARAALSMLHNASPEDQKRIKAAVHRRYPNIDIDGDDNVSDDAQKTTVSTDESLSQTRAVDSGPQGPSSSPDAEDGGTAHPPAVGGVGDKSDGGGDTAPDKDLHEAEAESQTHDNIEGNATKDAPGSPGREQQDDALAEKATALETELRGAVKAFGERDQAEGGVTAKERRIVSRVNQLLESPALLKEVANEMSASDVLQKLGEQDSARRDEDTATKAADQAAYDKAVKKAAKKLVKKQAEEAAKAAAEGDGDAAKDTEVSKAADETPDASKMSHEELVTAYEGLQKTVADIAAQDSAHRPLTNAAGVTAILRDPSAADNVFKALDDQVTEAEAKLAKATTDIAKDRAEGELQAARQRRFTAKLIAKGTEPSRFGTGSTELFKSGLSTLPEDTGIQYR